MQPLQQLTTEIARVKSRILNQLAHSHHPAHSHILFLLSQTNNAEWLDLAAQQLGPEYGELINRMTQLEAAVSQIDIGQYGYCCDCEEPISATLLARDPAIQRCEKCTK